MYISEIRLKNYRNFRNKTIHFKDGINLLIGPNNSGKSNILHALALIFDKSISRRLSVYDFSYDIPVEQLRLESPVIGITVVFSRSLNNEKEYNDIALIRGWLTRLEDNYEAQVHYRFFLSADYEREYKSKVANCTSNKEVFDIIGQDFINKYVSSITVGPEENNERIDSLTLGKFDFQFLDAIRDVESSMRNGTDPMLGHVIEFFMDNDIKKQKDESSRIQQLADKRREFRDLAEPVITNLKGRLASGQKSINEYASMIGADYSCGHPVLDGMITEENIYKILNLFNEYGDMLLPISRNGLGYNNLIYMALLLAKMQVDASKDYYGSNAIEFPILAIEEPEAHLHPTMQSKLVEFLQNNLAKKQVRQVFITSHSTHITSALSLDDMICFHPGDRDTMVAYPGDAFTDEKSKKKVQRYLDATRSNLMFAEKVILVEGTAERLLISILAECIGINLEDEHVSVIDICGRYFDDFLQMFAYDNCNKAMKKKVAYITDYDPTRKKRNVEKARYRACYPFEYGRNPDVYEYRANDRHDFDNCKNIRRFVQIYDDKEHIVGKTFEYELAYYNPSSSLLITDSINDSHKETLQCLMKMFEDDIAGIETYEPDDYLEKIRKSWKYRENICNSLMADDSVYGDEQKKRHIIAAYYLDSVSKGENAIDLLCNIKDNIMKTDDEKEAFTVPPYIADAIGWITEHEEYQV